MDGSICEERRQLQCRFLHLIKSREGSQWVVLLLLVVLVPVLVIVGDHGNDGGGGGTV